MLKTDNRHVRELTSKIQPIGRGPQRKGWGMGCGGVACGKFVIHNIFRGGRNGLQGSVILKRDERVRLGGNKITLRVLEFM